MNTKEKIKNVFVFTPTRLPGLDVSIASIQRQILPDDIKLTWRITDELYEERKQYINEISQEVPRAEVHLSWVPKDEGNERNLARAYNLALEEARNCDADLFISMQDYIYVPEDGIKKFIDVSSLVQAPHILTGICDISSDPEAEQVVDRDNWYSIFEAPYDSKPRNIFWSDVRRRGEEEGLIQTTPTEWEANWAAIGREALYDTDLSYDEELDKYVAYENQDYAFKARDKGYQIILDPTNQVISLPHKQYYADMHDREGELTHKNRQYSESKGYA